MPADGRAMLSPSKTGMLWGVYVNRSNTILWTNANVINDMEGAGMDKIYRGAGNDQIVGSNLADFIHGDDERILKGKIINEGGNDFIFGLGGEMI